ncbi:MAG: hypothetical protein PUD25_01445 [Bacilli bacterium]|nr:hypothetical protein [Bacilli bacterium]
MKSIVKLLGLLVLIVFSFFYTDKVIEVIREEDEVMIKIKEEKDHYFVKPIDAIVSGNTIIPGINGREVDVDGSYKKMKEQGIYNEKLFVFDEIKPKVRLEDNQDKFIISGNKNKKMVSLVFSIDSSRYLEQVDKILNNKNVIGNFFVDYSYLISNSTVIKDKSHHEFYSYGSNGIYAPDTILFANNLISRISNNEAIYCFSPDMSKKTLSLCSKNNLYTISPTIVGANTPYKNVKNKLESGSIIFLSLNNEGMTELPLVIDYIEGKGYKIVGLSTLLSE